MKLAKTQDLIDKDYRWKNRLVIVDTSKDEAVYKSQKLEFDKDPAGIEERKLLLKKSTGIELSASVLQKLHDHKVLLIGLDGGVKIESAEVFALEELFEIIDGMPMRRAEIIGGE